MEFLRHAATTYDFIIDALHFSSHGMREMLRLRAARQPMSMQAPQHYLRITPKAYAIPPLLRVYPFSRVLLLQPMTIWQS